MTSRVKATLPLQQWQGDRGTYHLVTFTGVAAETLAGHAMMQKLETGRARGFGSLKVTARIGETSWKTSVFPQNKQAEWVLLISRKVMKAEDLALADAIEVHLEI